MKFNDLNIYKITEALRKKTNGLVAISTNNETGIDTEIVKVINNQPHCITAHLPAIALQLDKSIDNLSQDQIIEELYEQTAQGFKEIRDSGQKIETDTLIEN